MLLKKAWVSFVKVWFTQVEFFLTNLLSLFAFERKVLLFLRIPKSFALKTGIKKVIEYPQRGGETGTTTKTSFIQ